MNTNASRSRPRWRRVPHWRRLRDAARALWPDRNALRRRSDRAEAAIIAVLLASFLAAAPVIALALGMWALLFIPGLAVTLSGAGLGAHLMIERRRLAAWETDWAFTGPRWTPHR